MSDDILKKMNWEVDWAIKNRLMMDLPSDFLAFIATMEANPTPENIDRLHNWNVAAVDYLQKKASQHSPQPQPEMFDVQSQKFLN